MGNRYELFVDEYLIERMENVQLRLHEPVPRNVSIEHDAPWEGNTSGYHTIFKDGQLFRAYYRGSHYEPNTPYKPVVCYAESRDGIEWHKPELGLVSYKGSTRNNIIWDGPGALNFTPFLDRNPNRRVGEEYKALGSPHASSQKEQALLAFKSSDGIHWSLLSKKPVMDHTMGTNLFDSQNVAFYDLQRAFWPADLCGA